MTPCADASSHLYKFQMLFARKTWTGVLAPQCGDSYVRRDDGKASKLPEGCVISLTDKCVQTDQSLSEYLCILINDLEARNIEWPVVIMTDGHSSRTSEKTTRVCRGLQLRIWLDMSKISAWRQMWDQLFKGFHAEYVRIYRSLSHSASKYKVKFSINDQLVMQIMDLMYGQHGFRWCTVGMIMRAFSITGVGYYGLDFSRIPEKVLVGDKLHKLAHAVCRKAPHEITEEDLVPICNKVHREGSAEYWKSGFESAMKIIDLLRHTPVLPKEMGLLDVDGHYVPAAAFGQQKRFTQVWGSLTVADLNSIREMNHARDLGQKVVRKWRAFVKRQVKARHSAATSAAKESRLAAERPLREFLVGLDFLPSGFSSVLSGAVVAEFLRLNSSQLKALDSAAWKARGATVAAKVEYLLDQVIEGGNTKLPWARKLAAITASADPPPAPLALLPPPPPDLSPPPAARGRDGDSARRLGDSARR